MHKHQGQVWVAGQAESLALRPGTSPMQACPSFPSWLGETRAGPQSREWLLQLLGRNLVHYASPGPTRVGAVSNKAASKMLTGLLLGRSACPSWHQHSQAERPARSPVPILHSPTQGHPSLARPGQSHLDHFCLRTTKQACKGWRGYGGGVCVSETATGLRLPPAKSTLHSPALFCILKSKGCCQFP